MLSEGEITEKEAFCLQVDNILASVIQHMVTLNKGLASEENKLVRQQQNILLTNIQCL